MRDTGRSRSRTRRTTRRPPPQDSSGRGNSLPMGPGRRDQTVRVEYGLDDEDLRWNLSRDRARRRRISPRNNVRRLERTRNGGNDREEDPGLSRTLRKLQQELQELKDGSEISKREEWKNRSNKIQFQYNQGTLKLLREILDQSS